MQERLAAREEDLADAAADGSGDGLVDGGARHVAEGPDVRAAVVEAVRAGEVAQRAAHLQPQVVEVREGNGGGGHSCVRDVRRRQLIAPCYFVATTSGEADRPVSRGETWAKPLPVSHSRYSARL